MSKLKFPSAQTILILIAGLVTLLTWLIPAGKYSTLSYQSSEKVFQVSEDGTQTNYPATQDFLDAKGIKIPLEKFTSGDIYKPIAIPGTYKKVEPKPQGFAAFASSPVKGIIAAADIIFLILIIGGLIGLMNISGAFNAGIAWLSKILKGREYLLIIITTCLIAAGGTSFGLAEETMAFYPILIPVFLAARYDAMVGLACIFLGSAIGTMCSTINPFATIIASDASGISWTVGLTSRIVMLILCLIVTIGYILRYARRVKADPSSSLIYSQKEELETHFGITQNDPSHVFTTRLKFITFVFAMSFVIMIVGVSFWHWWFIEMCTTFLIASIIIGVISGLSEQKLIDAFVKGAGELLGVAFIVGIARGVTIIMEDGMISDTILYNASMVTSGMPKAVFSNIMVFVYAALSFFMPSSSGMAVLTMPIMSPLADTVHIGREIIVDSYLYGMGLFYLINPTSLILAALAIVKIGFDKWLKFIMPLLLMLTILIMAYMTLIVFI